HVHPHLVVAEPGHAGEERSHHGDPPGSRVEEHFDDVLQVELERTGGEDDAAVGVAHSVDTDADERVGRDRVPVVVDDVDGDGVDAVLKAVGGFADLDGMAPGGEETEVAGADFLSIRVEELQPRRAARFTDLHRNGLDPVLPHRDLVGAGEDGAAEDAERGAGAEAVGDRLAVRVLDRHPLVQRQELLDAAELCELRRHVLGLHGVERVLVTELCDQELEEFFLAELAAGRRERGVSRRHGRGYGCGHHGRPLSWRSSSGERRLSSASCRYASRAGSSAYWRRSRSAAPACAAEDAGSSGVACPATARRATSPTSAACVTWARNVSGTRPSRRRACSRASIRESSRAASCASGVEISAFTAVPRRSTRMRPAPPPPSSKRRTTVERGAAAAASWSSRTCATLSTSPAPVAPPISAATEPGEAPRVATSPAAASTPREAAGSSPPPHGASAAAMPRDASRSPRRIARVAAPSSVGRTRASSRAVRGSASCREGCPARASGATGAAWATGAARATAATRATAAASGAATGATDATAAGVAGRATASPGRVIASPWLAIAFPCRAIASLASGAVASEAARTSAAGRGSSTCPASTGPSVRSPSSRATCARRA